VRGVPHVLLVDTTGKIVFKGHPANRKDLVKDFDDLLAGKPLEGVEAAGGGEDGGEEADTGKEATVDDLKKIMMEIDHYKNDVGKELLEAAKDDAKGMMRNFCVITLEAKLTPNTDKWT